MSSYFCCLVSHMKYIEIARSEIIVSYWISSFWGPVMTVMGISMRKGIHCCEYPPAMLVVSVVGCGLRIDSHIHLESISVRMPDRMSMYDMCHI